MTQLQAPVRKLYSGLKLNNGLSNLKAKLLLVPALALPNLEKPFTLYTAEEQSQILGVLTQKLGNKARPVGYFSKSLGNVAQVAALSLSMAATVFLAEDTSKLTMGQSLTVMSSHQVQSVLDTKGHQWMMGDFLTKYQAMLLGALEVILKTWQTLNPVGT